MDIWMTAPCYIPAPSVIANSTPSHNVKFNHNQLFRGYYLEGDALLLEAGDLIHPTPGLMKPGEGLAQVLSKGRKTRGGQRT